MPKAILYAAVLALAVSLCAPAQQYPRRRGPVAATASAGPYKGPAVTFHGTLKAVTKKEIIVDLDKTDAGQDQESMTFRFSKKTKFEEKDKEIKPGDIALGTHIWVDATRDGDLKLSAMSVTVAPLEKATDEHR